MLPDNCNALWKILSIHNGVYATICKGQVALEGNFGFVQDKSDLKSASDKKIVRKATVALENKTCEQNITPCCPSTNRDTRDLKMFSADEDVRRKKV